METSSMHILISPNAFKNSLNAQEAAAAVQEGLMASKLDCTCECFPVGDGGDGTAQLILEKFNGVKIAAAVHNPLGRKIKTTFGLINNGKTAVIEMADASGLRLLKPNELDPMKTSSYGTGELLMLALDKNIDRIIIGLGGSATVDGGAGLLSAMGVRFLDQAGIELKPVPEGLSNLDHIDISGIDERVFQCKITVLCDVDNYLLGVNGAATTFGPQKGAKPSDLPKLERVLKNISETAFKQTKKQMDNVKHGGSAGGIGAALHTFFNAELFNGAEYFLQLTNFEESLKRCDLLITGEGSLDEQTLQGKAPLAVAKSAKAKNIPVIGIAGRVPLEENHNMHAYFDVLMAIGHQPSELNRAMEDTRANLVRTGRLIGNLCAVRTNK
ncbi:MAG: glycerate kinase [Daejeonella sp.]